MQLMQVAPSGGQIFVIYLVFVLKIQKPFKELHWSKGQHFYNNGCKKREDKNERLLKTVKQKLETFLLLETEQVERGVMEVIVGFMRQLQRFVLVRQLHSTIVSQLCIQHSA